MKKEEKDLLSKFYLNIFLDITNYNNYKKDDIRGYADYDDYKKIFYISPFYRLYDSVDAFKFMIKKSIFGYRLEVRKYTDEKKCDGDNYDRYIIYRDIFKIKKQCEVKNKIKDIINFVDRKIFLEKIGNDIRIIRHEKIKKIIKKV